MGQQPFSFLFATTSHKQESTPHLSDVSRRRRAPPHLRCRRLRCPPRHVRPRLCPQCPPPRVQARLLVRPPCSSGCRPVVHHGHESLRVPHQNRRASPPTAAQLPDLRAPSQEGPLHPRPHCHVRPPVLRSSGLWRTGLRRGPPRLQRGQRGRRPCCTEASPCLHALLRRSSPPLAGARAGTRPCPLQAPLPLWPVLVPLAPAAPPLSFPRAFSYLILATASRPLAGSPPSTLPAYNNHVRRGHSPRLRKLRLIIMLPCQRWPGTGNSAAPTGRGFAGRLCASSIGLLTGRSLGLFRPPSRERYLCQLLQQWRNQSIVDAILLDIDGNQNTSQLGANAILGVSLSVCKAGAGVKGVPLYKHIQELAGIQELVIPIPSCNVMKGSSHAGTNLIMQEFLLLPIEASSFIEVLQDISKAQCRQDACTVVDDGGFAPNFQDNSAGNIETAGYTGKITIGMYVAGSEFPTKDGSYDHNVKNQPNDGAHVLSAQHLGNPFTDLVNDSPIDDPFDQDDWSLWASLQFSVDIQLAGDVLLNTNTDFHLVLRTIQFDCRSS